jgi:hypothetical protein
MGANRKPFACRWNLHHRWELAHTADGTEYVRCERCLKERGGPLDADRATRANVVTHYGSMH